MTIKGLKLGRFDGSIPVDHFSCQKNSDSIQLERFLKIHAMDNLYNNLSITYLALTKDNQVVGFFSLACGSIHVGNLDARETVSLKKRDRYPAIYIGRIAVDDRYQQKGIGSWLMEQIFVLSILISDHIGCRYLIVQSKPSAIEFYTKKFNFIEGKRMENGSVLLFKNIMPLKYELASKTAKKKYKSTK